MQISSYLPSVLTKLSEFPKYYFENSQQSGMKQKALTTSLIAAIHLGLASVMACAFAKARQADAKSPREGISRETLAASGFVLISPPATALASQANLMYTGYVSLKNGLKTNNRNKSLAGAALLFGTYVLTTNNFAQFGGLVERSFARLTR
jgi:hypothetical protein